MARRKMRSFTPEFRAEAVRPHLGHGQQLPLDEARLALPGRGAQPLLARGGDLVHGRAHRPALGAQRPGHGLRGRQLPRGLLHHSDRGSQYASEDYQRALAARGIRCSMSRKGNCWDNAVVESFFITLKQGLVYTTDFATHEQARRAVFEYIEVFYNRQRRHSALGYISPVGFELAALPQKLAA